MAFTFQKATKKQSRARVALIGPSGSGKTYTALAIACGMGGAVGVVDTERGSASKYADRFAFDVLEPESFSPADYVKAIQAAADAGIKVLVIDSLSHAWTGKGGALEMVDNAAKRSQSTNTFAAWRDVTPQHNMLIEAMLTAPMHVIVTMRAKTEYVMEKDSRGKTVPRKVGIQPVQRDGMEYEFDVVADMTMDNEMIVSKSRCDSLHQKTFSKPGADVAKLLSAWLTDGEPIAERPKLAPAPSPTPQVTPTPPPSGPNTIADDPQVVILNALKVELEKATDGLALTNIVSKAKGALHGRVLDEDFRAAYQDRYIELGLKQGAA